MLQDSESPGSAGQILESGNRTRVYSLSVVRLANPQHAQLALVNVTDSTKTVYAVCASTAQNSLSPSPSEGSAAAADEGSNESSEPPLCSPDTALGVNVSSETKWVSLQPGLLYPEVEGIRVEVKGQVLSQGGDVGADQIADTSGHTNSSRYKTHCHPQQLQLRPMSSCCQCCHVLYAMVCCQQWCGVSIVLMYICWQYASTDDRSLFAQRAQSAVTCFQETWRVLFALFMHGGW